MPKATTLPAAAFIGRMYALEIARGVLTDAIALPADAVARDVSAILAGRSMVERRRLAQAISHLSDNRPSTDTLIRACMA